MNEKILEKSDEIEKDYKPEEVKIIKNENNSIFCLNIFIIIFIILCILSLLSLIVFTYFHHIILMITFSCLLLIFFIILTILKFKKNIKLEDKQKAYNKNIIIIENENNKLLNRINVFNNEKNKFEEQINKLNLDKNKYEEQINKFNDEKTRFEKDKQIYNIDKNKIENEKDVLEEENKKVKEEILILKNEQIKNEDIIEKLKEDKKNLEKEKENKIQEVINEQKNLEEENKRLKEEILILKNEKIKNEDIIEKLKEDKKNLEMEKENKSKSKEVINEKELEIEKKNLEEERINELKKQMFERQKKLRGQKDKKKKKYKNRIKNLFDEDEDEDEEEYEDEEEDENSISFDKEKNKKDKNEKEEEESEEEEKEKKRDSEEEEKNENEKNKEIGDKKEIINNKINEVLEDMCIYGNITKKEIKEEKEKNPEKFIDKSEALKLEKTNQGLFALGLLSQNLEALGIETVIEKNDNIEDEEDESTTSLQFISNGLHQKRKYNLHFDFGEKRNEELLNDKNEYEKFKEILKLKLSKDYNIPTNKIIVTFPQKGSLQVQVIFQSDEFNDLSLEEFKSKFKNDDEFEELKNLKEIHSDILLGACKLSEKQLDYRGNRSDGWGVGEMRGNKPYDPPVGWIGIGLKVLDKYNDNTWIGMDNIDGEWCVAYHGVGTGQSSENVKNITGLIYKGSFKKGWRQAHYDCEDKFHPGNEVGEGVYCTPTIATAEEYAGESTINGKDYLTVLMVRVKPDAIRSCTCEKDYWVVNGTTDEIRPYRILYKEVGKDEDMEEY